MAKSLWVSIVDEKRKSCPNCKAKLLRSYVYSASEYVRGRKRSIFKACRECWTDQCKDYLRGGVDWYIETRYCTRPHWMQLPGREYLTPRELWMLDEIARLLISRARIGMRVVACRTDGKYGHLPVGLDEDRELAYIQTVEESMPRDEWEFHPLKDFCLENGIEWDEHEHGGYSNNFAVSFLLPRRDGRTHAEVEAELEAGVQVQYAAGFVD